MTEKILKINNLLLDLLNSEIDQGVLVKTEEEYNLLNKEYLKTSMTYEQAKVLIDSDSEIVFNFKTKRFGKKDWYETILPNETVFFYE